MYAEIIVLRNHANLDQLFTYTVPLNLEAVITVGSRVMVPFGGESLEGVVWHLAHETSVEAAKLKAILFCFEPTLSLPETLLNVTAFMKETYLSTHAEVLQLLLPTGTLVEAVQQYTFITDEPLAHTKATPSIKQLASWIQDAGVCEENMIDIPFSQALVKRNLKQLVALNVLSEKTVYVQKVKDRYVSRYHAEDITDQTRASIPAHYHAKHRALDYLIKHPDGKLSVLREGARISKSVIDWLKHDGLIKVTEVEDRRMPSFMESVSAKKSVQLSPDQTTVVGAVRKHFLEAPTMPVLLRGVTGSGKTEVYMALIDSMLKVGRRAIYLVPEIALTPQMVSRLAKRFGASRIALMHSKLSAGERFDQWKAMREGSVDIVIGARSAIFAPIDNIGIIIIDESHEHSYRSERRPKFDTYEIAKYRALQEKALLIEGSATPSIDSVHEVLNGRRQMFALEKRYNVHEPPKPEIIDMRQELTAGNRTILSRRLYEAIEERLERGEQSIIFLNRTGHSTFVTCRSCGYTLTCPNCDITLTYHKHENKMSCHYCQYESFVPRNCPSCGSSYFKHFGVGTEKLEETLKKFFPHATIGRMDRTTTSRKGSFEAILERVETEEIDILVGTQMIAKGLDFENVTLVGIISVDLLMNMPHFQAGEMTYQMVQQVSGRAGRGALPGEVILQTYQPEHYAINCETYHAFYEHEIALRQRLNYPPFCRMVNLLFLSRSEATAEDYAEKTFQYLKANLFKKDLHSMVEIFPAHPALLKKIDGNYRFQVLMKVQSEGYEAVKGWVDKLQTRFVSISDCKINIDLNAKNIL
ncbi:primosomal protein N' [Fusibacter paucivorans]|uniref:Replication restart protein PriA n=1 Tax=Fusibacter paucivorans TaxID=76009 RepID=A0ABS5PQI9_9FIRM|nr:primosomal protein N' [Fusibacter paucivorans]MBS7527429.1 primosomal protein N' [Fusibacter paucivorans]